MSCFGKYKLATLIYSCFWGVLMVFFILIITLNRVEELSEKQLERSKEIAKPQIQDDTSQSVQPRDEFVTTTSNISCQPLHFIPNAETRPVTALVSFPGSGNTWLRYLIQQSTGVHTGSQFVDDTLKVSGFPGEPVFNASVAVVKTHQWGVKIRAQFQKAVLLIRRPQPAIQALFNLYNQGHTGCASKENYERDGGRYWTKFVQMNIRVWQLTHLDWLRSFKGPLHIVLYDQLRDDLGPTLRSLVQFLDLPLNEDALQCTVEHAEGLFHRKSCPKSANPFSGNMKKIISIAENLIFHEVEQYKLKK